MDDDARRGQHYGPVVYDEFNFAPPPRTLAAECAEFRRLCVQLARAAFDAMPWCERLICRMLDGLAWLIDRLAATTRHEP